MENQNIGFIGGGNMASSLVGGLIGNGHRADAIHIAEPDPTTRQRLNQQFGVQVYADNSAVTMVAEVLVLAVKPNMLREVSKELSGGVRQKRPLLISIAAGVRAGDIVRWLGAADLPVVRVMPNTPALIGAGASALFANAAVSDSQRDNAGRILGAVGLVCWVADEQALDAVTAISGSGPAYFLRLIEALQSAGEAMGLPAETARQMCVQTALGAARLAQESGEAPAELRRRVSSPGGTTERALDILQQHGFADAVDAAARGAAERSRELADQLGGAD